MIPRKAAALLLPLALCLLPSISASAQSQTTGRIAGTVTDQTGAVIAGAEVMVVSLATADERKAITDTAGNYTMPLLPPGAYQLSVTSRGFKTALLDNVMVAITETTVINAELEVAALAEEPVTIRAATPLIQTDGPQLGRVVDSRALSQLPLATRNFTQILGLSPGAATYLPDNTAVGRNTQTISVNGARVTQNNFEINGIDINTMGTAGSILLAVPAPETIQEFKVQTSLYDATFGRSGGGNIQIVTKSGANFVRGVAYEYFRDDALNANNPFLKAAGANRPVLKRNVFGGTLGGPIKKDKAFFFISYQGTRERNGASILNSLSSSVLIARGLTDDRSEQTLLRTFAVPSVHPAALALLNVKLPNGQFLIPTPRIDGRYSGSAVSRYVEDQFNANFDYHVNHRNWLAVKFFLSNAPSTIALPTFRGSGANVPGFGNEQELNNRVAVVQDVHTFSSRVLNEARIGYTFNRNFASPQEPVKDSDVGIRRANAGVFPGLPLIRIATPAGGVVIGTQTNISPATASVTSFADTLSITRGKHIIRTGGEVRYNEVNGTGNQFRWGQIDFSDFKNFLTGNASASTLGSGIGHHSFRAADYNLFVQDDWRVAPRLVVNIGARYELDLPVYETRGLLSTFDPSLYKPRLSVDSKGGPVGPPIGGFVQAGNVISQYDLPEVPNVGKTLLRSIDPNNLAFRIGFAFSPLSSNRLVVRAGSGLFYSRGTFQYASGTAAVPPAYILGRRTAPTLANPFFDLPSEDKFPTFKEGVALSGTVFDRGIRTPYFYQYNTSLQYELIKNMMIEVAYVGTRGLNLFRQLAINQARLASPQHPIINEVIGAVITTNIPGNARLRAPFQGVDISGFFQNQSTAQSTYNSLQASLTNRFSHGVQLLASYTYARSIDNASGQGGGAGVTGVINPGSVNDFSTVVGNQLKNRANRGVSDFDHTHRFVLSYVWSLPSPAFASKSSPGRLFLSNWEVAGIIVAMSGLPIDIVDALAGDLYGLNGPSALARPSWAPGASHSTATTNVPPGYFFNPFAFAKPVVQAGQPIPSSSGRATAGALGTDIGNVGRNILRGPQQSNFDFSIIKRFRIDESKNIEFRAEFFNLFNQVNLANPISDFAAIQPSGGSIDPSTGRIIKPGAFGRIISTSNNPRIIQFAVKVNY